MPKTLAALKARVAGANGAAQPKQGKTDGKVPEHLKDYKSTGRGADLPKEKPSKFKKLNDAALADPEKWIFDLFPAAKRQPNGEYRVTQKSMAGQGRKTW